MRVLEVEGCRSSVVRALVAKARGPGFESLATTKGFFHFFPLLHSESFNLVFMKGQNLIIVIIQRSERS